MKDSHGRMRTLADKFISCDAVMCLKEADGVPVMTVRAEDAIVQRIVSLTSSLRGQLVKCFTTL